MTNDYAQSRFCVCTMNSEYENAGLCYTQRFNSFIFTTCEESFLPRLYEVYVSRIDLENVANFNLLQNLYLCTQKSVCTTSLRPFGEVG